MEQDIDWTAYPVLRIDQISLVTSEDLQKTNYDAKGLLAEITKEYSLSDRPPLASYLERQINHITNELTSRSASQRLDKVLLHDENSVKTPLIVNDISSNEIKIRKEHKIEKEPTNLAILRPSSASRLDIVTSTAENVFKPLPLPSELRGRSAATVSSPSSLLTSTTPSSKYRDESFSFQQTASVKESYLSSRGVRSRRPRERSPSRLSVDAVNRNFGNIFMVAATEKKIRFYPKKKAEEANPEHQRLERYRSTSSLLAWQLTCVQGEDSSSSSHAEIDGTERKARCGITGQTFQYLRILIDIINITL